MGPRTVREFKGLPNLVIEGTNQNVPTITIIEKVGSCDNGLCSVEFEYRYRTPRSVSRGLSTRPYMQVETEYLIWNEAALIGNVGGALGLIIGFSFLNMISWN